MEMTSYLKNDDKTQLYLTMTSELLENGLPNSTVTLFNFST